MGDYSSISYTNPIQSFTHQYEIMDIIYNLDYNLKLLLGVLFSLKLLSFFDVYHQIL